MYTREFELSNLKTGKCSSCYKKSNEIKIKDGRCITCLTVEEFTEKLFEDLL